MPAIAQINFPYTESQADLEKHSADAAPPRFTGEDGLKWKVWLVDEKTKTAGGIYLFTSRYKVQGQDDFLKIPGKGFLVYFWLLPGINRRMRPCQALSGLPRVFRFNLCQFPALFVSGDRPAGNFRPAAFRFGPTSRSLSLVP